MKGRRSNTLRVFAHPLWIGLLTAAGLFAALLGDGGWDMVSWIGMGVPAILSARGLLTR